MPQLIKTYTPSEASTYIKAMSNFNDPNQHYSGKPFNFAEIIKERVVALRTGDIEAIKFFLDQYFDTPDALAYPAKNSELSGRFKFVSDSDLLLNVNDDSKTINGALELPDEDYAGLKGSEFIRVNVDGQPFALLAEKSKPDGQYRTEELYELGATPIGRHLGSVNLGKEGFLAYKDEAVNSDLWLAFLRGDRQLLTDYRNAVSEELSRRKYNDPNQSMGVYLGSEQDKPSMSALFASRLRGRSDAGGREHLDGFGGRLVWVRSRIAEGDAQNSVAQRLREEAQRLRATADSLESLVISH